jgi:hypothetical protein
MIIKKNLIIYKKVFYKNNKILKDYNLIIQLLIIKKIKYNKNVNN